MALAISAWRRDASVEPTCIPASACAARAQRKIVWSLFFLFVFLRSVGKQ